MKNPIKSSLFAMLFCSFALSTAFSQVGPNDIINPNLPDVFAPPPTIGPNLVVTLIGISDLTATSITFSFAVKNVGNENASLNGVVALARAKGSGKGKAELGSIPLDGVSSLAPGQTHLQAFSATFPKGNYQSLCVTIDAANALQETQEGDNELCTRNWLRGSSGTNTDLTAKPSFAGASDLGIFRRNDTPGFIFFQVVNTGPVEAPSCKTLVEYGRGQKVNAAILDTPAVPPYGTVTLKFSFPLYNCSKDFIKATIDHDHVVPETNENNNVKNASFCAE